MQHPHYTSTTTHTVSPKLNCYLALYFAGEGFYEPLVIVAMHPVLSMWCLLKYDLQNCHIGRCHFVWARINCPRESLTQHAKDVKCYGHRMQHPHYTSTTTHTVSPKLNCYLALYFAGEGFYEPLAIAAMHLMLSLWCLLKYDELHSK